MSILCRIGWHDWSKWLWVPVTFDGVDRGKQWKGGQYRSCAACGLAQVFRFKEGANYDIQVAQQVVPSQQGCANG